MTAIPGTDLTTEAARNRATRMLNEHDAALMVALADAYDATGGPMGDQILAERATWTDKGYTPEHDREHGGREHLLFQAMRYATSGRYPAALALLVQAGMTAPGPDPLERAIDHAKTIAARDKYSPQEAAAAEDVVDALQTLRTTGETIEAAPDEDDRDGKQIARAAEWVTEGEDDDECD